MDENLTPAYLRTQLLLSRSQKDWGEAPKYNEEYRQIRWPGIKRPENRDEDNEDSTNPLWRANLVEQRRRKSNGRWNGGRIPFHKRDTELHLKIDLEFCMRENIPFKTKSIEYKPSDQWVYVYGNRTLKYDLNSGRIIAFTYSGVYNKVTSLVLRLMGLNVRLQSRSLIWEIELKGPVPNRSLTESVPININTIYYLENINWFNTHKCVIDRILSPMVRPARPRQGPALITIPP